MQSGEMMFIHAATHASDLALWTHWLDEPGASVALVVLGGVYAAGVRQSWRRAGRGRAMRSWQVWSFSAGFVVLVAALISPIDALSDDLFAAHMLQHVLLAVVAPPLLVAGSPMVAALWALPATTRRRVVRGLNAAPLFTRLWRSLSAPSVAWVVHAVAIWAWHVPRLYTLAVEHPVWHAIEHLSFVATAGLLWWGILYSGRSRRASYGIGLIALFATMLQSGALGALLTLSRRPWYPVHAAGEARWNLAPLADQQLAGLIMWVPAGLLYLAAMSGLFLAWLRSNEAKRRIIGTVAAGAAIAISACSRADASIVPGGDTERGRQSISTMGCGSCHTVAGVTGAHGLVGPPLTGIARRSIIAGQLPNTPENMLRWISDPPAIEPGTAMPNLHVRPQVARDMVAYLYTLR